MRPPFLATLLLLLAGSALSARDWMGVKRPQGAAPAPGDSAFKAEASPSTPKTRPKAETSWVSRTVRTIPVGTPGTFLGTLEGVRCFNCEPGTVHLNLGDSLSREAGFLSMRLEVWNAIERPLRDRRMFDYANLCFFFGYRAVDTVQVGGDHAVIRIQEVPCYPYLQRRLASRTPANVPPPAPGPVPAPVPASPGTDSASPPPDSTARVAPTPAPTPAAADSSRKRDLPVPRAP